VDKILLLSNGTVSMFGVREEVLRALAPLNAANARAAVPNRSPQAA
jgi:ATP-binding cassette subfamily C protein